MSDLDENLFGGSSDEDDDDAAFSYGEKKEFHKKAKRENNEHSNIEPSPPKRGRKAQGWASRVSTDDALSKLEHKRERRKATKPSLYDIAAQDDSDSDVEIVAQVAASKAATTTNANKNAVDLLDDSSDEEAAPTFHAHRHAPVALMQRSGVAKETCDKIAEARNAVFKLRQAQRYHAEDVYVPAAPAAAAAPSVVLNVDAPSPAQQSTNARDFGPSIPLKLRSNQVVNGKRSSNTMETMTIRRHEPFQKLLQRYQQKHSLNPAESSVKFIVDGDRIDLYKTPSFYDLERDNIIEVLVTTLVVGKSSSANSNGTSTAAASTVHLGPQIKLKMRTQDTKNGTLANDVMTIRAAEPLQKLMDKYKKAKKVDARTKVTFSFDGDVMNLERTPAFYEMESEDIVDVVCK